MKSSRNYIQGDGIGSTASGEGQLVRLTSEHSDFMKAMNVLFKLVT